MRELPIGTKLVGSRRVFDIERNQDGSIKRFKARLVAQGFSQKAGLDCKKTFAPTVKYDPLRLLFALAAADDLEIHQVDLQNAYLAGELKEQIYMRPPEGLKTKRGQVCLLVKSLYGLKQAERV